MNPRSVSLGSSPSNQPATRLYGPNGTPCPNFNQSIKEWLEGTRAVRGHQPPAAFSGTRALYSAAVESAVLTGLSRKDAHRLALSNMTTMLFKIDLSAEIEAKWGPELFNSAGFRSSRTQAIAKNIGENFINVIVFALASLLANQDEVLVDKGLPPWLKKSLTLKRTIPLKTGDREIRIPIEGDATIFSRNDHSNAILISAKTRLKEVFHIGTMWKIIFDMLGDDYCKQKWGLEQDGTESVKEMLYVFATADMVATGGARSQGADVERALPRNLIAMDASFFDYVFVSKTGIAHVENSITLDTRGALFHELGCLVDLIEQKFGVTLG